MSKVIIFMVYFMFLCAVRVENVWGSEMEKTQVTIFNEVINPVNDMLFGQFMERPSWGETGAEAAIMPDGSFDSRVVNIFKKMNIPVVRFPGGTDVDYLNWKDMVSGANGGDIPRPVSTGHLGHKITNKFGFDEFLQLAEKLKWKTILVVNLRDGLLTDKTTTESAENAAALLAYCTGNDNSVPDNMKKWPKLRITNGRTRPYKVDYIQIGNETWFFTGKMKERYGDNWISVWADAIVEYIKEIRKINPEIKIIADGYPLEVFTELNKRKADINLYAFHRYYPMGISKLMDANGKELSVGNVSEKQVWDRLVHSTGINADGTACWNDNLLIEAEKTGNANIKLAMTEWNLNAWWRVAEKSDLWPGAGACGLGAAVMLNAIIRAGGYMDLATQSMLVGKSWGICSVKVFLDTGNPPVMLPAGASANFYNQHHGNSNLKVIYSDNSPQWKAEIYFNTANQPCEKAAIVDVAATRDKNKVYIHAVNTDYDKSQELVIKLDGFNNKTTELQIFRLCYLTKNEKGDKQEWIKEEKAKVKVNSDIVTITLPPRSTTIAIGNAG